MSAVLIVIKSECSLYLPGKAFFERLHKEYILKLMHPNAVKKFLKRDITCDSWMRSVVSHVICRNEGQLVDRALIVVVESQTFYTNTTPPRKMTLIVSKVFLDGFV